MELLIIKQNQCILNGKTESSSKFDFTDKIYLQISMYACRYFAPRQFPFSLFTVHA